MNRYIGLELFRGTAAIMVMVCHYAFMLTEGITLLTFMWTGVDLFFVISGFVFARFILSKNIEFAPFIIRRFFRIYPLYIASLILYFLITADHQNKIEYFVNHMFFLNTTNSREEFLYFNGAFWSLPVEVEFYLLVPLLCLLGRFKHTLIIVFIVSLCSKAFIYMQMTAGKVDIYTILDVHITGVMAEFIIGVFAYKAVIYTDKHKQHQRFTLAIASAILGMVMLASLSLYFVKFGLIDNKFLATYFGVLCATGYALLIFCVLMIKENEIPTPMIKSMLFLGSISYPVYLIHNSAINLNTLLELNLQGIQFFLAAVAYTVFVSILLHKIVEEPVRLYGRRLSKIKRPAVFNSYN